MPTFKSDTINTDLIWLLKSPLLTGIPPPGHDDWTQATYERLIASLVEIPAKLVAARKPPIGRYFESLVALLLDDQPDITALHHNIAVRDGKQTVGEFDILFSQPPFFFHWELSVKFYLGTGDRTKLHNWYGPMARDRFDIKLDKLATKQLRLSQTAAGQDCLHNLGIKTVFAHELVKGRLFHPFDDWQSGLFTKPPGVNPLHDKGWWLYHNQVDKLQAHTHCHWVILDKVNWLAPINNPDTMLNQGQLMDFCTNHFNEANRPLAVAAINNDGQEIHRGFIQPNHWPAT